MRSLIDRAGGDRPITMRMTPDEARDVANSIRWMMDQTLAAGPEFDKWQEQAEELERLAHVAVFGQD